MVAASLVEGGELVHRGLLPRHELVLRQLGRGLDLVLEASMSSLGSYEQKTLVENRKVSMDGFANPSSENITELTGVEGDGHQCLLPEVAEDDIRRLGHHSVLAMCMAGSSDPGQVI